MTADDIPYLCAITAALFAICMLVVMLLFFPYWRGWGAVLFVTWPMALTLVMTLGFIGVGVVQWLRSGV